MITVFTSLLTSPAFWGTFIGISLIPYGMYGVAYLFESRRPGAGPNDVPVWKDQSRAFLPGDFGLALMVAVCLQFRGQVAGWVNTPRFVLGCLLFGLAAFLFSRWFLYTPHDYTRAAWTSPSKRYHDFVMFWLFTAVAVAVCVPVYVGLSWKTMALVNVLSLFGLALWAMCNVYDFTHHEVPNPRQHPTQYQPIWQRATSSVSSR